MGHLQRRLRGDMFNETRSGTVLYCFSSSGGAEGVPIVVMNANSWSFYFNEINAKGGSKWER